MINDKINYDEFVIAKEIPLLFKLRLQKIFRKRIKRDGKILIVDASIVGDFLATLPALSLFLKKNKLNADIIVSPNLKTLSQKIKGIENVFTAKSLYSRKIEQNNKKEHISDDYQKIIFLRTGQEGYEIFKKLNFSELKIYDIPYFKFFFHVLKCIILKKPVKQWREINFEILDLEKPKNELISDDIFEFSESDYGIIKKISELKGSQKKILIHTGTGWNKKLWENKKWVELLKKINKIYRGKFKFIFIGGTNQEKESFNEIQKDLDFKIYSLIAKIDLKEMLLVMHECDYFIGIDSGPRNLAHLADLRSITLLGPVLKNFMPPNKKDIVIDKSGNRTFTLFYFGKKGIENISTEEVFNSFKKLLRFK